MHEIPEFPLFDVNDAEVGFGADRSRFYGGANWDNGKAAVTDISRQLHAEEHVAEQLFFKGGSIRALGYEYREGIDGMKANRALQAILGSWEVSHEQKMATAALAIHHWMQPIKGGS